MKEPGWQIYIEKIHNLLSGLSFHNEHGQEVGMDEGFSLWKELTLKLRNHNRTVFMIGNGASASMASHLAADLAKNTSLHTEVFSDLSLMTAISNDLGYEKVFAEPLRHRGRPGDMLVAISSSGKSPNILAAVGVAKGLDITVVTLSSMDPANPLRSTGTLNAYISADTYGIAETCHAAILHYWMDLVEKEKRSRKTGANLEKT